MATAKNNVNTDAKPQKPLQEDFSNEIPNAETLAAFAETEEMLKNPEKYKSYKSISELREALEV